jgi:hypothetical protein
MAAAGGIMDVLLQAAAAVAQVEQELVVLEI